jgi:hypothetical protein
MVDRADGELGKDVEEADGVHLVAQQLDAGRLRRAEAEHVHDAAAQRELAHLLDGGHALEAHLLQPGGKLGELYRVAGLDLQPQVAQPLHGGGKLLHGAGGGHHQPGAPAQQRLQRLYPRPADLQVRLALFVRKAFALGIKKDLLLAQQGLKVAGGLVGVLGPARNQQPDALRLGAMERGQHHHDG